MKPQFAFSILKQRTGLALLSCSCSAISRSRGKAPLSLQSFGHSRQQRQTQELWEQRSRWTLAESAVCQLWSLFLFQSHSALIGTETTSSVDFDGFGVDMLYFSFLSFSFEVCSWLMFFLLFTFKTSAINPSLLPPFVSLLLSVLLSEAERRRETNTTVLSSFFLHQLCTMRFSDRLISSLNSS